MKRARSRRTLPGVIPAGAKNVSLFFILHPDPNSNEPPTLEMEASRNGHPGTKDAAAAEAESTPAKPCRIWQASKASIGARRL